jgi:hypothetical protein
MSLDNAYVPRVGPLFTFSLQATSWNHAGKSSPEKIHTQVDLIVGLKKCPKPEELLLRAAVEREVSLKE